MLARQARRILDRGRRINNNSSRLQKNLGRLALLSGLSSLVLMIHALIFEWDDNDRPLTASIGEGLAGLSLLLFMIVCCLPTVPAVVENNENAEIDVLDFDADENAGPEGENFGDVIIIQEQNNDPEFKLANNELIDLIDVLSRNQPIWDLLTDDEIENFRKIIVTCQDADKKQHLEETLDSYLENIQCYISTEILRLPFIPITIQAHYPYIKDVSVERSWVKTFDAAQLKIFINSCTIQGKIAYAPHSPDDKLNVKMNIKFTGGFSEIVAEFVREARLTIKSASKLSRGDLRLYHADFFARSTLFSKAEAKKDLNVPLLSSDQGSSASIDFRSG